MRVYCKHLKAYFVKKCLIVVFILGVGLALPAAVLAAMTSTNYTIYADSVGFGGGGLTTSTSYSLEVTGNEIASNVTSTSTSYEVRGGYQAMDRNDLTIALSSAAINLGSLSDQSVTESSTTVTITALSTTGYTLSLSAVTNSTIPFTLTDGEVTAGSEEYGLAASGPDSAVSGDASVSTQTLATSAVPVSGQELVLTFKASRGDQSTPGEFNQTVTLTVSANF